MDSLSTQIFTGELFEYEPLAPGFIRLLQIHYDSDEDSPIHVSLETAPVSEAGEYDALSYTWGPSSLAEKAEWDAQIFTTVARCYPIFCNGRTLLVTRSLLNVLRVFRDSDTPEVAAHFRQQGWVFQKRLWADGICINQSDLKERGEQVPLMGKIYSAAATVVAYVGEPDAHTRPGIEAAIQILDHWRNVEKRGHRFRPQDLATETSFLSAGQWRDWAIFLSREWFLRTWVLQEVILAAKVMVRCGSLLVPLDGLLDTTRMVGVRGWHLDIAQLLRDDPAYQFNRAKTLSWLRGGSHPSASARTWSKQLHNDGELPSLYTATHFMFRSVQCLVPQDRIYGTLAVVQEFRDLDQTFLPVDYTMTVQDTFIRATKYSLWKSANLDVLSAVEAESATGQLPSWCPDYEAARTGLTALMSLSDATSDSVKWKTSELSSYSPSEMDFCDPALGLRGVVYDTVVETCKSRCDQFGDLEDHNRFFSFLLEGLRSKGQHSRETLDSTWRTLLLDTMDLEGASFREAPVFSHAPCASTTPASPRTKDYFRLLTTMGILQNILDPEQNVNVLQFDIENVVGVLHQIQTADETAHELLPDPAYITAEWRLRLESYKRKGRMPQSGTEWTGVETGDPWGRLFAKYADCFPDRAGIPSLTSQVIEPLHHAILKWVVKRKLFRTASGRIGLGPAEMRARDRIGLCAGGRLPLLIRPREDGKYALVGDSYVQGIMYGEEWPGDESSLTSIVLV